MDINDYGTASPPTSAITHALPDPTADSDAPDPPYFFCRVYYIVIVGVCQCVLYVVAMVGNVLCFVTWNRLGRRKGFNSSVIQMQALAVSDLLTQIPVLYIHVIPNMLSIARKLYDTFFVTILPISAKYGVPIANAGHFCTVMFTSLMTIHRYCVLSRPFSTFTRKLTSVKSTLIQIVCIVVIGIAYQIPRVLSVDIVDMTLEDGSTIKVPVWSSLGLRADYLLWYYTIGQLLIVNLLPQILSAIFTILILHSLAKARKNRKNMTNDVNSKRENTITVILLTVVILFIVSQLPATTVRVYFALSPGIDHQIICGSVVFYLNPISILFSSINSSVNIFIYTRSSEFRNELKAMFCCGKGDDENNTLATTAGSTSMSETKAEKGTLSTSKSNIAVVDGST